MDSSIYKSLNLVLFFGSFDLFAVHPEQSMDRAGQVRCTTSLLLALKRKRKRNPNLYYQLTFSFFLSFYHDELPSQESDDDDDDDDPPPFVLYNV